jgi:hypothetical protein
VAIAVSPRKQAGPGEQAPARWAAAAWAVLWLGGVLLQLRPGNDTNASLRMALAMNASGAPGWLAALDHHLSALVPHNGVSLIVDLVVLQALTVIGGLALSLVFWVAGQDIGQLWTGLSADPNTAPLMMLLGVTVLGAAPWRQRRHSDAG